jgi:hypothetical protein
VDDQRGDKMKTMYNKWNKPVPQDCMRTFTNLVVKKDEYNPPVAQPKTHTKSRALLPKVQSLAQMRSISTINAEPGKQGTAFFMTGVNVDASNGGSDADSSHYLKLELIDFKSTAFNNSQLELRFQDRRILKSEVDSILSSMNTKTQKSLYTLDQTVEKQIKNDIKTLARENETMEKEYNELVYQK